MNWFSAVKKVGSAVVSTVIPGGEEIIKLVNEFLPKDKKLGENATGADVEKAIETLPPEQRAQLLSKQLDVEITEIKEFSNVMAILAEADKAGASTRPKAAMALTYFVIFVGVVFTLVLAGAVVWKQTETLKLLNNYWPLALSLTGPPIGLLERYFGKRTKEKQARYSVASGIPLQGGVLSSIISAFKR